VSGRLTVRTAVLFALCVTAGLVTALFRIGDDRGEFTAWVAIAGQAALFVLMAITYWFGRMDGNEEQP
jgi:hypothetical protein